MTPPDKQGSCSGALGAVLLTAGPAENDSHIVVQATNDNGLDPSKTWCARADMPLAIRPEKMPIIGRKAPVSAEVLAHLDRALKPLFGL